MKHLSFLGLVAIVLLALTNCQKPQQQPQVAFNPSQANGGKIVYVNIDTLLEKYKLYQDERKKIEDEAKRAESSIASKIEAFQKKGMEFQRKVYEIQQKASEIAPKDLQAMEAEFGAQQRKLADEEQALMKQRDNASLELEKKISELQKNLKSKIDAYLEKISAERGYDYVLMKGVAGSILFGSKSLDITEETIKAINEEYEKNKK